MNKKILFTDGSADQNTKVGFAAFLLINENEIDAPDLSSKIKLQRFENTSSTKLEIQALLWALKEIDEKELVIYTDCQNIIGLKDRRLKLEQNNYHTKTGKLLKNHEFYKEFFSLIDKIDCEFIKVKGHKKTSLKNDIDKVFTLVDKASRNALRESSKS